MAPAPFSYDVIPLPEERNERIKKDCKAFLNGLARIGPAGTVLQPHARDCLEQYHNMEVRPTDVFTMSLPATGSNWIQEMVWLITNDLDYDRHKTMGNMERAAYLEIESLVHPEYWKLLTMELTQRGQFTKIERLKLVLSRISDATKKLADEGQRFFKTHLPFAFLPDNLLDVTKVVYVARNPFDMCVSLYHHYKLFRTIDFQEDLPAFCEYFKRGEVQFLPFWPHVLDAWKRRDHPNLHFVQYEDMKKDFNTEVRKLATFLGKSLTDAQIEDLHDYCCVENARKNPAMNFQFGKDSGILHDDRGDFIRKGKAGVWEDHLSPEMKDWMKKWMHQNLEGTGLHMTLNHESHCERQKGE